MKNQVLTRSIIGLVAILSLYGGYTLLKEFLKDPDTGSLDSTSRVAAVEYFETGSQIVLFDTDGKKTVVPDYEEGRSDIEPVWRPDGQRVFFASDRGGRSNNIYRWNIADNTVEQRSMGSRSEGALYYGPLYWPDLNNSGLITLGGTVQIFDQREKQTKQVLPPTEFVKSSEEEEAVDLAPVYQKIGSSFKEAKWGKDRQVIYSVMRREDDEIFVINYMEKLGQQKIGPVPIVAGHSIQFEVAPDGSAVVAVQNFDYPDPDQIPKDMIKNGKVLKPFRNVVSHITIRENGTVEMQTVFTDFLDIGISPLPLNAETRKKASIPANVNGVFANVIAVGAPLHQMGARDNDVLVSINDVQLQNPMDIANEMSKMIVGDIGKFTYYSTQKGATGLKTATFEFGSEPTLLLKDPTISPDSKWMAVSMGRLVDRYNYIAFQLVIVPLEQGGVQKLKVLVQAPIFEPSWSPDGKQLVYTKLGPSGDSQIFTINVDGSGERNLSGPGDFGRPRFSPMIKK